MRCVCGCCRPSYIEGRLRLAESRERRQRGQAGRHSSQLASQGAGTTGSEQERLAAEQAAEANMARLLEEENAAKVGTCAVRRCVPECCSAVAQCKRRYVAHS